MSEREAFQDAIAADFEDDSPRLVFADWLDDRGEHARAEFIRVQCAAEAWPEDHPERNQLDRRANELLREHRRSWFPPILDSLLGFSVRRGFLDRVSLSASGLPTCLPILARTSPPVRLDVSELTAESATALARLPELTGVRRLTLSMRFSLGSEPALSAFLRSPHLSGVVELDVSAMPENASTAVLPSWPGLARLQRLGFHASMGVDRVRQLLQALSPSVLRSLVINTSDWLSAEIVGELLAWPGFADLRQLSISDLDTPALRLLAESRSPTSLVDVNIRGRELSPNVCLDLLTNPSLSRLRDVRISQALNRWRHSEGLPATPDCEAGLRLVSFSGVRFHEDKTIARIAESSRLASVSVLRLRDCGFSTFGLHELARSPHLSAVRTLDLGGTSLAQGSFLSLAGSPSFQELAVLDLGGGYLGLAGVRWFSNGPWTETIRELRLSRCSLSKNAMRALVACPFEQLRVLRMCNVRAENDRFTKLVEADWFAQLEEIHLHEAGVDDAGLAALAERFGDRLHTLDISNNPFSVLGLRALLARPLPALIWLRVGQRSVHAPEAHELARWPGLANLRELHLEVCTPESLSILAGSPYWGPSTILTLRQAHLDDASVRSLGDRVQIVRLDRPSH